MAAAACIGVNASFFFSIDIKKENYHASISSTGRRPCPRRRDRRRLFTEYFRQRPCGSSRFCELASMPDSWDGVRSQRRGQDFLQRFAGRSHGRSHHLRQRDLLRFT
jgi:hypothetical protein